MKVRQKITNSGTGSIYECKSCIGKLYQLLAKGSAETMKAIVAVLHGHKIRSITYDNGLESAMHKLVNELMEYESYFCKPYRPWKKGWAQNYNGLFPQYFPKGHDLATITPEHLQEVEDEINNRSRNILSYQSPNDLLGHLSALSAASPRKLLRN